MMAENGQLPKERSRSLLGSVRGSLICAAILLFLDVIIYGCFGVSFMVCPIWFLVAMLNAAIYWPGLRVTIARLLIVVATLFLVLGNDRLQRRIANANAANLIQACEHYRSAEGSYPEELKDLVPRYIDSVPPARYCLFLGEFQYYVDEPRGIPYAPSHMLYWQVVPPFGRKIYHPGPSHLNPRRIRTESARGSPRSNRLAAVCRGDFLWR